MSQKISFSVTAAISFLLLFGMLMISLVFGAADTTVTDVWQAWFSSSPTDVQIMLREIRFPRELAALLVGSALAVSGAIMQGMTRNPLADPGLLGLTAGSSVGLSAAVVFWPNVGYLAVIFSCFAGAALGAVLVFGIGMMKRGGFSPFRIVLAGSAVSAFLYAIAEGIGLYFRASKEISMWTSGGLMGTNWTQFNLIAPLILVALIISLFTSKQLTILSLNEEVAIGLGQQIARTKVLLFILIIILTGASVALAGNVAFLGLMVPHLVRPFVGSDYRFILPISSMVGGSFLLLADTLGRTMNAPYETPVAAIISVVGLPFFLFIVHKGGKQFG